MRPGALGRSTLVVRVLGQPEGCRPPVLRGMSPAGLHLGLLDPSRCHRLG